MNVEPAAAPRDPDQHRTDEEIARHIAEACDGLRRVARGPRFKTVSYLLGLAKIEAEKVKEEPWKAWESRRPSGSDRD